jgi:TP901 family phage tail tape measure protein
MPRVGVVYVDVRGNTVGFDRDVKKAAADAERTLRGISTASASAAFRTLQGAATTAAAAVGGIGIAAIKANTDFSKAISGVGAVANASAADMERLRQAALRAGADTSFSASEAANAEAELAKAGVAVNDILGGALSGTLGLAAAGQLDLADAATIAAQALNIFGLSGDQTTRVADVLAAGANKSAADVGQLGDALRQGGLVASQLGIGLEDSIGVLSLFADNALIGSDAGTSFKTMLQRLVPQSEEQAKAMEALGLSFFDASGKFVGVEEAAGRLQRAMSGLTQEQRSAAMTTIFGSDAVRAASLLYEAGSAGVAEYTKAVTDQGAAARMAATQLDNLAGDLEAFKGSVETALIGLGDAADPALRSLTSGSTELVNVLNRFASSPAFAAAKRNVTALSGDIEGVFDTLARRLETVLGGVTSQDIDRVFRAGRKAANEFRQAIDGVEGAVGGLSLGLASMAAGAIPVIGGLVPAFNPVAAAIAGLVLQSEDGRDALGEMADAFIEAGKVAGPALAGALEDLTPPLIDLVEAGAELAREVLPLLADTFADVAAVAGPLVANGLGLAADAIGFVADNAEVALPVLAGLATVFKFEAIAGVAQTLGGIGRSIRDVGIAAQLTVRGGGGIQDFVELLGGNAGLTVAAGVAGLAVAGLGYVFLRGQKEAAETAAAVRRLRDAIDDVGTATAARDEIDRWLKDTEDGRVFLDLFAEGLADMGTTTEEVAVALVQGGEAWDTFRERALLASKDIEAQRRGYESYADLIARVANPAKFDLDLGDVQRAVDDQRFIDAAARSLNGSLGEQKSNFDDARKAQELYNQITKTNRTDVERLTAAVDALSAAQDRNAGRAKNVADAELRAADTAQRQQEALAAEGGNTATVQGIEAQRRSYAAIRDNIQANIDLALAQQAAGASAEETALKLVGQQQALQGLRDIGVITEETYRSLLEQFALTPSEIETTVLASGLESTQQDLTDLETQLNGIDDEDFVAEVKAMIENPTPESLASAQRLITEYFKRFPPTITPKIENPLIGNTILGQWFGLGRPAPKADGGFVAFGSGGMTVGRLPEQATIQPAASGGGLVQWAEPETGGEAFIPMGTNKREKALPVLEEVARRFGYALTAPIAAFADGGVNDLTRFVLAAHEANPARYEFDQRGKVGAWVDNVTSRPIGWAETDTSDVYRTKAEAEATVQEQEAIVAQPTGIEGGGEGSTRDMDPMLKQFLEALAPKEQLVIPDFTPIVTAVERLGGQLQRPNNYTVGRIEGGAARRLLADALADDRREFEVGV